MGHMMRHSPNRNSLSTIRWDLLYDQLTIKFEVSMFTHYKDVKGKAKCLILG